MFFKTLRTRRSSKPAACQSISDTPPPRASSSASHCASSPNAPANTTRAIRPDEEVHDYELFLERARTEEEKREKARQQEVKEAERRRAELSMDPWTKRM